MRGRAWVVVCVALLGVKAAQGQVVGQVVGQNAGRALSADEIVTRMMQHDAERKAALAQYASERTYHMEYHGPIGERQAQMRVRMEFSAPDRKRFTVESESGSMIFCHQVLRKLMEGEQEGALEANHLRSMLSPENDHLKLVGEERFDGVDTWVLEVTPKEENQFNYKGKVWVSKADYAVVRIVGAPAKNPIWLMGNSNFDYKYAQSGEFWLPERNDTVSHLRIGGEIKLTVDYGEYRIVAAGQPDRATSAANNGGRVMAVKGLAVSLPQ